MAEAINTYQEEPAESQEHIDAMLAKVEGSQQDPERPGGYLKSLIQLRIWLRHTLH